MVQPTAKLSAGQRPSDQSLWNGLIGDGIPALATVGVGLAFAGGLAVYFGLARQLLPHDLAYLGVTATDVDQIADGRVMDFMVHDRVSWGGSLFAVGVMYLWLIAFPLRWGRRWAWRTLAATGILGFASFASHLPTGYLGFASFASHLPTGYLDSWHGLGTMLLIPCSLSAYIALVAWSSQIRPLSLRGCPPSPGVDGSSRQPVSALPFQH